MARTNKAVDMLAQGQPIYYTGAEDRSYEGGRAAAKTWADYITYEMEHGPFDVAGLESCGAGKVITSANARLPRSEREVIAASPPRRP